MTLEDRFWARVDKRDPAECWLWIGQHQRYGQMLIGYRKPKHPIYVSAHRFSYELAYGDIPEGLLVRHSCDVPLCVNPLHLLVGTQADNVRDRVERGRTCHGVAHPCAKLTPALVREARERAINGESTGDLARMFGVHAKTMQMAITGQTWKSV